MAERAGVAVNKNSRSQGRPRILRPAMLGAVLVALGLFAGHEFLPTAAGTQELSNMCVNKASGRVRWVSSVAQCNTRTENRATLPGSGPIHLCAAATDGMVRKVAAPGSCTGTETAVTVPQTGPTFFCYKPTTGSFLRLTTGVASCAGDECAAVISVPVAVADTRTVLEDTPLIAGTVLANDTDALLHPLTASLVAASGLSHAASFTFNADGTFNYTPNADYNGPDSFSYTATDGTYTSVAATASITVDAVNDAPTFALGGNQTVTEGDGLQTVTGFATGMSPGPADESGQAVTFSTTNNDNAIFSTQPSVSAAGDLTYQVAASVTSGSATVSVTLTDNGGVANGGVDSTTHMFTITVAPAVNDAPENNLPASPTVDEDAVLTMSGAGAISVSDPDAGANPVEVTLTATNGRMTLSSTAGLTFVPPSGSNDGTDDTSLTFTGTISAVNTALNGMTFAPTANFNGAASIAITTDDQGNSGTGGAQSDSDTLSITVTAVNDPPMNTVPGAQTAVEDTNLVFSPANGNGISIADIDAGGSAVKVSLDATNGTITLSSLVGLTLVDGTANGQASVHFTGTISAINTALQGVTFRGTANFSGAASLSITTDDQGNNGSGGVLTDSDSIAITVSAVNDPPTFTLLGNQTVAEDGAAQSVANFAGSISPGPGETGQTPLTFTVSNDNTPLFSAQPAISSAGTLTYTPAANAFGVATVSVTLTDSGTPPATSPAQTFTITVTAVNDAPVNTAPASFTVNEDTDFTFTGTTLQIADIDAGASAVKVSLDATSGTVTLSTTAGLTFVDGTANGTASVHVTGTLAAINTALTNARFRGNLNYNSTRSPAAALTMTTNDQGNTGTPGPLTDSDSIAVTVNAVNDPPVAAPFAFNVQTNMKRTGIGNLLAGATDPDSGDGGYTFTPTIESGSISATSPAGGTISNVNLAAGTFDFDPPPGVTGAVTFTFRICDNGSPAPPVCSAAATATATVSGTVIWFVDPNVVGPGDGRLSNPFKQLSSAGAVDASGHRIFMADGTVNSGIVLHTNEWLIGEAVTGSTFDAFFAIAPPANTIARPPINGTRPTVQGNVDMDANDHVRGLNITVTGATQGLSASSATGLAVSQVSVTSATGIAVNLTAADGTFAFTSVSATGAPSGIVWDNTSAATGSLTVEGDGSGTQNGSGGTISGSTASSVRLDLAHNVTLKSMNITNPANVAGANGIFATELTGSSNVIRGVVVSGVSNTQASSVEVGNTAQALGSLAISGSKITDSTSTKTAMLVRNLGNQPMAVTVNTTEFSNLFPVAAQFASGQNTGATGTLTVTFTGNQLLNAPASGAGSVNFVGIQGSTLNATATGNTATNVGKPVAGAGVFSASAQDTASVNAKINSNTISNINGYEGINLAAENSATTLKVEVDGNTITGLTKPGITLNVNTNAQSTHVTITDNVVGTNASPVGTGTGVPAILIQSSTTNSTTAKTANVLVHNNTAVNNNGSTTGEAFQVLLSGSGTSSTTLNLTVTNNSFDNLSGTVGSGYMEAAWSLGAVCLDMTGNNSNSQSITVVNNGQPFVIRNRDTVVGNNPSATLVFSPSLASFGTQVGACPQPTLPPI